MKLIAGKINNCNTVYYWNISDFKLEPEIGDYAIVENMGDYDLVKVVGIVETSEKYARYITNCNVTKKVVMCLKRNHIRED